MHVASVGEYNSVRWLLNELKSNFEIALTYFSPRAKDYLKKSNLNVVQRVPLTPLGVMRFEKTIKPAAFLLVERELWPSFKLIRAKKLWIGAYSKGGLLERWIGKDFELVITKTQKDADNFKSLGINAKNCGNLKWVLQEPKHVMLSFSGRLLILGSSHEGEEALIKRVFKNLLTEFKDLKLIVAPRHIKRSDEVLALFREFKAVKKSQGGDNWNVLILDTLGELFSVYKYATVVIMGGTFVKVGGHNIAEALFFNKPVVFGPYTYKIQDMVELALKSNLGYRAADEKELQSILRELLRENQRIINQINIANEVRSCYLSEIFGVLKK